MSKASPGYVTGQQNRVEKTQVAPIAPISFFTCQRKLQIVVKPCDPSLDPELVYI